MEAAANAPTPTPEFSDWAENTICNFSLSRNLFMSISITKFYIVNTALFVKEK